MYIADAMLVDENTVSEKNFIDVFSKETIRNAPTGLIIEVVNVIV